MRISLHNNKKRILCILLIILIFFSVFLFSHKEKEYKQGPYCDHFLGKWDEKNRIFAHALGGINGKTYTNSIDALKVNYSQGKRYFETDFALSSDGQVILTHDWEETTKNLIDWPQGYVPTYEEFKANKIYYKYEPSGALDLLKFMDEHSDMYLMSDIKYNDPGEITAIMQNVVELAKANGYEGVLDRFIVQFYFEQNYYDLKNIYPFKNWVYALYAEKNKDFEGVTNFCLQNNISAVLMSYKWVKDPTILNTFQENGIKTYVYTLNNLTNIYEMLSYGVYGFISDYAVNTDLFLRERYMYMEKFHFNVDLSDE